MEMNCKLKKGLVLILVLIVMPVFNSAFAEHYPFSYAGTLESSTNENQTVINDTVFSIAVDVQVYSSSGLSLALSDLQLGDKVGCNFYRIGQYERMITELYKLPSTFDLEEYTAHREESDGT